VSIKVYANFGNPLWWRSWVESFGSCCMQRRASPFHAWHTIPKDFQNPGYLSLVAPASSTVIVLPNLIHALPVPLYFSSITNTPSPHAAQPVARLSNAYSCTIKARTER